jgi:hypothetical protein
MAHSSFTLQDTSKPVPAEVAHKQLEVEKFGVILGFLAGLVLAVGPVMETLDAHDVAGFITGVCMVATVAVSMRLGLRLGSGLAALLEK